MKYQDKVFRNNRKRQYVLWKRQSQRNCVGVIVSWIGDRKSQVSGTWDVQSKEQSNVEIAT